MHASFTRIETDAAPKAIGPYSQAVLAGPYLFISGQIPLDVQTGQIIKMTIEEQTKLVLDYIGAILKEANLSFEHIVKTEVYLKDMEDFAGMNAVYAIYFPHPIKPARQAMQVGKLPRDARVEISAIAYHGSM